MQRGAEARGVVRIVHQCDIETGQCCGNTIAVVAGDNDDGGRLRGQGRLDDTRHHRPPIDIGQELVDRARAGRAARRQDECGDPRRIG